MELHSKVAIITGASSGIGKAIAQNLDAAGMNLVLTARSQKAGHILNRSAIAGFTNVLGFSVYGAAKFGLEGISEAVQGEVAPLGIKVTIVEPGPFRTDFIGRSLVRAENSIDAYNETSGKFLQFLDTIEGRQPGDPDKAAQVLIQVVESENPPLRLVLGKYAYSKFRQKIASLTAELDAWEAICASQQRFAIASNTDFETATGAH